ncbi:tyrosine-type recombinase/integrase [Gallaecimonas pentaromativorans]|uniref:Site-specific recombinase XerD n=1 Tax=Gallaecimonas pentaromativorans TaxID=584787 RepID=A0A3N1PKU6_9GAMM|nr:tyrosine-type recombinase/integrase [Gallaecimonas pentaromativorans]ROQ27577.1 site-specific recombinase XerD [Gallaecimonas pentaromativorans]
MSLPALPDDWLELATAPGTRSQYSAGLKQFVTAGFTLPASPSQLKRYLGLKGARLSVSTLRSHISAIKAWHRRQGFVDPVNDEVRQAFKALGRLQKGTDKKKAATLSRAQIDTLLRSCEKDGLLGLRDGVMISLGLAAAMRRSELANLRFEDVERTEAGLAIRIRFSKTDQQGLGKVLVLPKLPAPLDPGPWLQKWREQSALCSGLLLRRVNRHGAVMGEGMTTHGLNHALQKRALALGLEGVSCHSLRRSFATLAVRNGVSLVDVAAVGRWQSLESLKEYVDTTPKEAIAKAFS